MRALPPYLYSNISSPFNTSFWRCYVPGKGLKGLDEGQGGGREANDTWHVAASTGALLRVPGTPGGKSAGYDGAPTPGQGCLYNNQAKLSTTRSQQNYVLQVAQPGGGPDMYIWTGDRWQQAPDGVKGHEGQFWAPLSFDQEGNIQPVDWVDSFEVELA